jgi:hypothetical protein
MAGAIRKAEQTSGPVRAEDLFKMSISTGVEQEYRLEFDEPANFLKHADRDPHAHWAEHKIDAEQALADACSAYLSVMHRVTPEMLVYTTLWLIERGVGRVGDDQDSFPGPMRPVATILEGIEQAERRSACLNLLDGQRDILNNLLRLYESGRGPRPEVGAQ